MLNKQTCGLGVKHCEFFYVCFMFFLYLAPQKTFWGIMFLFLWCFSSKFSLYFDLSFFGSAVVSKLVAFFWVGEQVVLEGIAELVCLFACLLVCVVVCLVAFLLACLFFHVFISARGLWPCWFTFAFPELRCGFNLVAACGACFSLGRLLFVLEQNWLVRQKRRGYRIL